MNDCGNSGIFSGEKFVNGSSTGESSAYLAADSLTTIAAKRDSPLTTSANGQLPPMYQDRCMETIAQDNCNGNPSNILYLNSRRTPNEGLNFTVWERSNSFTLDDRSHSEAHSSSLQSNISTPEIVLPLNPLSRDHISRSARPRSFYDNIC